MKYLLVKGKAGLGNRMLCALSATLYAEVTGRQLVIDWSDVAYSADRENAFPLLFRTPTTPDLAAVRASDDVFPEVWRGNLALSVDELMDKHGESERDGEARVRARYSVDLAEREHRPEVIVRWSFFDDLDRLRRHLDGPLARFRPMSDEQILHAILREQLLPVEEICGPVEEFRARWFGETTIGLHIRHTDRKNDFSRYPDLIDRILAERPNATLFLATDNRAVEEELRARYRRLVVTDKWYPEPGVPLHRMRACPDKLQAGREALTEMFLLSRCDYLIYDKTSTFGLLASLISNAPAERRIDTAPVTLRSTGKRLLKWVRARF
jgi:hypothetical protein